MPAVRFVVAILFVTVLGFAGCTSKPAPPSEEISLMFVQEAESGSLSSGEDGDADLSLQGAGDTTLWFTDRPYRAGGLMPTQEFVDSWATGDDSFAADPPNGVLVIHTLKGSAEAFAVELLEVQYDASQSTLEYVIRPLPPSQQAFENRRHDVQTLEQAPSEFEDAALFIDNRGEPPSAVCQYDSICVTQSTHKRF